VRYKYKFQGQERQDELHLNWDSFKWRNYDFTTGRFMSIDPLAEKYPHNSTYAFSENRVIDAVELEGLEAFTIHGTESKPSTFNKLSDEFIRNLTGNETVIRDFQWPEGTNGFLNNENDRQLAARALTNYIIQNMKENENITLIGHSHGGNVAIQAVNMIKEELDKLNIYKEINVITIATPAYNGKNDIENPQNSKINSHIHFYSEYDIVQTFLANLVGTKNAAKTYDNNKTLNIKVEDTKLSNEIYLLNPYNPSGVILNQGEKPLYNPINSHFIQERPELLKLNK
jgi:RHS repeat-associated protein